MCRQRQRCLWGQTCVQKVYQHVEDLVYKITG